MSYRIEKNGDLVIDGWEKGIAASPFEGIADLKNANIGSVPGEVSVNFKTAALTLPPTVSALAFTVVGATDVFTVASTSGWFNGMAITLNTTNASGTSTGRVYWIGDLTATTFKLYVNPSRNASALVNAGDGSGTLTSYTLGAKIIDRVVCNRGNGTTTKYHFLLDENGLAWFIDNSTSAPGNTLVYLGNDTTTGSSGRGIAVFKGFLIVARAGGLDGLGIGLLFDSSTDLDGSSGWDYDWENISSTATTRRPMLVGQDDVLYYVNGSLGDVGSITETAGSTFNPSTGGSWVENTSALDLKTGEIITELAELAQYLLVATNKEEIYPWDRVSPSFNIPIILPERGTVRIVSTNQLAYVFAGNRGNIYVTDGVAVKLYKKIPDHLSGKIEPYITWGDATFFRNNLVFSMTADENDGTDITALGGVWALNLTNEALRHINSPSFGTGGEVSALLPDLRSDLPAGGGLLIGWKNSTNYGVDMGSSNPYSNYETVIDTDIIPIGTNLNPRTPKEFEFKLSRPLVSGEGVKLYYRVNLSDSFTLIDSFSTAGIISGRKEETTFEDAEWVQFRMELSSTNTTPSKVPLRELRVRL